MPRSQNPLAVKRASAPSPIKRASSETKNAHVEKLDDIGSISSLVLPGRRQDVISLIKHILDNAFDQIPERAGLSSTQISSTLRFQKSLPPIVSTAHLYALSASPTSTERELARLIMKGVIRKVSIPGRGKGGSAIGDGVVVTADWQALLQDETALTSEVKEKYLKLMDGHRTQQTISGGSFNDVELRQLITTGYLTTPTALSTNLGNLFASPTASSSLLNISNAGYKAATGTIAAVGGIGAVHESGGSGSMLATSDTRFQTGQQKLNLVTFSLPNTGAYLKLLANARMHLLFLLKQMSPKWREATIDLLREKWEGGFGSTSVVEKKRVRGESNGLLPGKTRKWKEFNGLSFDYVLAEALGSGVVELFDTGSVGMAVRASKS